MACGESVLLDLTLLEVVHVDMDAICAKVSLVACIVERPYHLLLESPSSSCWRIELVEGQIGWSGEGAALKLYSRRGGSCGVVGSCCAGSW